MNIIFIGAHPDDLEILCGGTIAKCVADGNNVYMAVSTNGNVGSPVLTKEEIAAIRKDEAEASASTLGASLIWLDEDDEFLFDDKRTRLKFVDAIREARADIIVAHNPNDYHPDHNASSKLATDARILSAVRLIETEHAPLDKAPEVFYMDAIAGINFIPQFYVDITDTFDRKIAALNCHASQDQWLKSIFGQSLAEIPQIQAAYRGLQAQVKYAEAFLQPAYWPRKSVCLPFIGEV